MANPGVYLTSVQLAVGLAQSGYRLEMSAFESKAGMTFRTANVCLSPKVDFPFEKLRLILQRLSPKIAYCSPAGHLSLITAVKAGRRFVCQQGR